MEDNQFLSGFVDPDTDFQLGDGDTFGYMYDSDLVIQNCGDVSSVVIIKFEN